jgi:hypothetical protein
MEPVSVVVDTRQWGRNTISNTGIAILFIIVISVLCVAVDWKADGAGEIAEENEVQ